MKTLLVVAILGCASASWAAERTISIRTADGEEARLSMLAAESNRETCENFSLPPTCTFEEIVRKHTKGDPKNPPPDPTPVIYRDGWDYFIRALASPALAGAFTQAKAREEALVARAFQKLSADQKAALMAK